MDKFWIQLLLAICTVLGGLSAVVYFHEKLRLPSLASQKRRLFGSGKSPLNPGSISAYVHTSPRSRDLDKAIAEDFGLPLRASDSDWQWLLEETQALGLQTVKQLDQILAKHGRNARLLARTFRPIDNIEYAHGLQLALEIEAMERFGSDWYANHLSKLKLTRAGQGYANDLWSFYQHVKAHGA